MTHTTFSWDKYITKTSDKIHNRNIRKLSEFSYTDTLILRITGRFEKNEIYFKLHVAVK